MMIGVENVPAEVVNEPGHPRDDALTVFAMDQQDYGVFLRSRHGSSPL